MNTFTKKLQVCDFIQFFRDYRTKHGVYDKCYFKDLSVFHGKCDTEVTIVEILSVSKNGKECENGPIKTVFTLRDYGTEFFDVISSDTDFISTSDCRYWQQFLYDKFGQEYVNHVFWSLTGVKL